MILDSQESMRTKIRTIGALLRSSLGPESANKLIIQQDGTVTTTAVGSLLIDRLELDGPEVTLLKQATTDFRSEHGDGSSTLLSLTTSLLDEAHSLSEMGLHPTTIERGYRDALATATQFARRRSRPLSTVGAAAVARTALTGTQDIYVGERMSVFLEEAWRELSGAHDRDAFGRDQIGVVTRLGGSFSESRLVDGVMVDARPANDNMPRQPERTRMAVFSSTVDTPRVGTGLDRTELTVTLDASSFEDREAFSEWEHEAFRTEVRAAARAGCGVFVTRRSINEKVESVLANCGILAIQDVDREDVQRLVRLTGATVVPDISHVSDGTLGTARVSVERRAGRDLTVFESTAGEPTYTLFCRGPDTRAVDAFEDAVGSAVAAVHAAGSDGVVPGGGAVEIGAALVVDKSARQLDTREQLAVAAFSNALLDVPRALARNAGLRNQDAVATLRAAHDGGEPARGVDTVGGALRNVLIEDPIADPTATKVAVWSAATDLVIQLVRIDDRIDVGEFSWNGEDRSDPLLE